jgi:hypothetical protein
VTERGGARDGDGVFEAARHGRNDVRKDDTAGGELARPDSADTELPRVVGAERVHLPWSLRKVSPQRGGGTCHDDRVGGAAAREDSAAAGQVPHQPRPVLLRDQLPVAELPVLANPPSVNFKAVCYRDAVVRPQRQHDHAFEKRREPRRFARLFGARDGGGAAPDEHVAAFGASRGTEVPCGKGRDGGIAEGADFRRLRDESASFLFEAELTHGVVAVREDAMCGASFNK